MKSEPTSPISTKDISFGTNVKSLTVGSYIDSLSRYRSNVDEAIAPKMIFLFF